MFVDDKTVIDGDAQDSEESDDLALRFCDKKRVRYSHEKCYSMIVNKKKHDPIPSLVINVIPEE